MNEIKLLTKDRTNQNRFSIDDIKMYHLQNGINFKIKTSKYTNISFHIEGAKDYNSIDIFLIAFNNGEPYTFGKDLRLFKIGNSKDGILKIRETLVKQLIKDGFNQKNIFSKNVDNDLFGENSENQFNQFDEVASQKFNKEYYNNLKEFIDSSETFYSATQDFGNYEIESFSYRLASWTEFESNEFCKEMRGIAFSKNKKTGDVELFTLGYHKFFNYGEGVGENSTINLLERGTIESVNDKLDGSLILFGKLPNGEIIAKSKTSINSDQAIKATQFLKKDKKLHNFISKLIDQNLYPIFEYVGPDNRIVVTYKKSDLILTGIRSAEDGSYFSWSKMNTLKNKEIPSLSISKNHKALSFKEVLKKQQEDKGYEGFVVSFSDGNKMKVKLKSYVQLHHSKDEINNVKKVVEMALDDNLDDLRTLFIEDQFVLDYISRVEKEVFKEYNHLKATVEKQFEKYKHLSKKDFAIINQKENKAIFSLLINKYMSEVEGQINKKADLKNYILENINFKHLELK